MHSLFLLLVLTNYIKNSIINDVYMCHIIDFSFMIYL